MGIKNSTRVLFLCLTLGLMANSCAHMQAPPPPAHVDQPQPDQTQMSLSKLQEKVQDLETRLGALNDKINLQNGVPPSAKLESKLEPKPETTKTVETELPAEKVITPPAHGKVIPKKMAEENFRSNESVDRYREAKILFDSGRYSDAVVEFSDFVKNESDHPLAPAAQYFLGISYLKQKEYKLAEEELSRGLLSYPHSNYIPDTLLSLVKTSDALAKSQKATYYREKLLSLFPNSPQAKNVSLKDTASTEVAAEMKAIEEEPKVIERPSAPARPSLPSATQTEETHE